MATSFRRIDYFCFRNKREIPSNEHCTIIGKRIWEHFLKWKEGKKMKTHRILSVEPDWSGFANSYPRVFHPEMDKIIAQYFQEFFDNTLKQKGGEGRTLRKRKPVQKPAFSGKNLLK